MQPAPSLDLAGDLYGTCDASQRPVRPASRWNQSRRPITFCEGWMPTFDFEATWDPDFSSMDVVNHNAEDIYQHQGPTIGSIRCFDDALHTQGDDIDAGTPTGSAPRLRVDTRCPHASTSKSPLALASTFLDTLAGLIHSPASTPIQREAAKRIPPKRTSAILIFDSEVFVDIMSTGVAGDCDEQELPTPSAFASPSMDWEYLVPFSNSDFCIQASQSTDEHGLVQKEGFCMDMAPLIWF